MADAVPVAAELERYLQAQAELGPGHIRQDGMASCSRGTCLQTTGRSDPVPEVGGGSDCQ